MADEPMDLNMQWVQRRLKYVEKQIDTLPHKFMCALDDRDQGNRELSHLLERLSRRLDAIETTLVELPSKILLEVDALSLLKNSVQEKSFTSTSTQTTHPAYAISRFVAPDLFRQRSFRSAPSMSALQIPAPPVVGPPSAPELGSPTIVSSEIPSEAEGSIDEYWENALQRSNTVEDASDVKPESTEEVSHLQLISQETTVVNTSSETPEESSWQFPITCCEILWHYWFYGDGVKGPFRFLTDADVPTSCITLVSQAKTVMDKLMDIAIEEGVTTSVVDLVTKKTFEFKHVFRVAFNGMIRMLNIHVSSKPYEWTYPQLFDTLECTPYQLNVSPSQVIEPIPEPDVAAVDEQNIEPLVLERTTSSKSVRFEDEEVLLDQEDDEEKLFEGTDHGDDEISIVSCAPSEALSLETEIQELYPSQIVSDQFSHVWSDRSVHRTPEGWRWPSVSCREMWQLWFLGDPANDLGPFRYIPPGDMCGTSKDIYCYSKVAMDKLIDISLANLVVQTTVMLDSLSVDALMNVFDKAFDILLHNNPEGNLVGPGRDQLRPESDTSYGARTIGHRISKIQGSRRHEMTFQWPDGVARRTPPGWEFPKSSCKAMWILWFRGDSRSRIGPFYDLREVDVPHIQSRAELLRARYVMTSLIDIAVRYNCAPSIGVLEQMPLSILMEVFAKAFSILTKKIPDSHRVGDSPLHWKEGTLSCKRVYTAYHNRRRSSHTG